MAVDDVRDLKKALDSLVPSDRRTGDDDADLLAAAHEAARRRVENSAEGGTVIAELHRRDPDRWSWRGIEKETGIPQGTARRWAGAEDAPEPE